MKTLRILAVASGGGHWIQLLRLRPAFDGFAVTYASVLKDAGQAVAPAPYYTFPDANRSTKLRLLAQLVRLAWIVARTRPNVVITTGAAPGYLAVRLGRLIGAKTLFLDSIANAERLSLSGHLALRHADVTLTQWQSLERPDGPHYRGTVL